jgi:hypothetical protein
MANQALAVTRAGNGGGTVSSTPDGISCGSDCTKSYASGAVVTLTAVANSDSTFTGWSGAGCTGTDTCEVTMNAAVTVTASFTLRQFVLTVSPTGNGSGTVTSSPTGISCGADCTESYNAHTVVTLTAAPAAGSVFTGWSSGGCSGTGTCAVTMDSVAGITASFTLRQFVLTVSPTGNGSGTVTSSPPGISCGADCTESYNAHTVVTLTAAPAADSVFTGWSGGGCSGTGTCAVTMDSAAGINASFTLRQFVLTVSRTGNGSGTVTSSPTGISCGADCTESYNAHTVVTLTAAPAAGSVFTGWSGGGCSGTGTCQVTVTSTTSVTAAFTPTIGFLAVTNFNPPGSIEVFAIGASGNTAPLRVIAGPTTTLSNVRGVAVFNGEIIVADQGASAVDVFPVTASGDVAPIRRIAGPATGFSIMSGMLVFGGEIYVPQQTGSILVFPLNADGNVAPSRTITGLGSSQYLAITGGEIYTADAGGRILVFPASTSGAVVPTRVISGPATALSIPAGILVSNGEIFVTNHGTNQISVFPQAANGDVAPSRVIAGSNTGLGIPDQIAIFAGELYVSNLDTNNVGVFPVNASGNVVPARQIVGPSTLLQGPVGAFVF